MTDAIIIKLSMSDPKGVFINSGRKANLTIECVDGFAVFYFDDSRVTERFAKFEIEADKRVGVIGKTRYSSRIGKATTSYPEKTKEEVRDIILAQLKKMNLNARVYGK